MPAARARPMMAGAAAIGSAAAWRSTARRVMRGFDTVGLLALGPPRLLLRCVDGLLWAETRPDARCGTRQGDRSLEDQCRPGGRCREACDRQDGLPRST